MSAGYFPSLCLSLPHGIQQALGQNLCAGPVRECVSVWRPSQIFRDGVVPTGSTWALTSTAGPCPKASSPDQGPCAQDGVKGLQVGGSGSRGRHQSQSQQRRSLFIGLPRDSQNCPDGMGCDLQNGVGQIVIQHGGCWAVRAHWAAHAGPGPLCCPTLGCPRIDK